MWEWENKLHFFGSLFSPAPYILKYISKLVNLDKNSEFLKKHGEIFSEHLRHCQSKVLMRSERLIERALHVVMWDFLFSSVIFFSSSSVSLNRVFHFPINWDLLEHRISKLPFLPLNIIPTKYLLTTSSRFANPFSSSLLHSVSLQTMLKHPLSYFWENVELKQNYFWSTSFKNNPINKSSYKKLV